MQVLSRQRGVSLIEVLMAVLIFSIGLIGLAGLLVMATRSNEAAYLRTQVTFLAGNMADRMRANPMGVWNGNYNTDTNALPTTVSSTDACLNTACSPAQLAKRDQQIWVNQLKTFLPNQTATVICTNTSAGFDPVAGGQVAMRPPYGGNCLMTISWDERKEAEARTTSGRGVGTQKFAWNFQP
ncbi:type IV pilus modification protein PilV [Dyella tabacisoli]|nr:type IV pilus modification protein PilV [Dyella tabacisoli]